MYVSRAHDCLELCGHDANTLHFHGINAQRCVQGRGMLRGHMEKLLCDMGMDR